MVDYYKLSLEILYRLLKESGNDHWANWISKDINEWIENKKVDHHLSAFGGMGSINDISVGGADTIGIWKNKLFDIIKNISWSFAKGKISKAPTNIDFYKFGNNEISGWRCRKCGHARINKVQIEDYLSTHFLPILIVDLIENNEFENIIDMENFVSREDINAMRELLSKQIIDQGIIITNGNEWLCTCPKCESKDVCVYRWTYDDKINALNESNDNLKLRKKPAYNRWFSLLGLTTQIRKFFAI